MGYYYQTVKMKHHKAREGEILEARALHTGGAALFGDKGEIACIPHEGCRLEIAGVAEGITHPFLRNLLPGQVVEYYQYEGHDYIRLPGGQQLTLGELVGFRVQLAVAVKPPDEVKTLKAVGGRELALVS